MSELTQDLTKLQKNTMPAREISVKNCLKTNPNGLYFNIREPEHQVLHKIRSK